MSDELRVMSDELMDRIDEALQKKPLSGLSI